MTTRGPVATAGGVTVAGIEPMRFEWDKRKAAANLAKHGVSFQEATTVFGDPLAVTFALSRRHRLLIVAHTQRGGRTRIITARLATRSERNIYAEG